LEQKVPLVVYQDGKRVEMSCECYERKGITYRQKCLLHKGVQDGRR